MMTATLERPPAMSVAPRNFDTKEKVNTMTATAVLHSASAARRARPRGLDRLVMRLSLAMLMWARHRADRSALSHEEHTIRRAAALAVERDLREAELRISRVF
jgi:hypothetical protein